ncbi:MAG: site-specific integrase [Chloroflexi bacterium]|nr:site-specific integrase [Chloroflexota bacterium]
MTLLDRFAASLDSAHSPALAAVREYFEWQSGRHEGQFTPIADDDVELRTYFLHLRTAGANRAGLNEKASALKRFYDWLKAEGLIEYTPFEDFNLERPFLSRDEIRRRQETLSADSHEREIARLRALNHLAEQLNRSADVQSALDATLAAIATVKNCCATAN